MNCPRCGAAELVGRNAAGIPFDHCPACHGLWVRAIELERLVAARPGGLLAEDRRNGLAARAQCGSAGAGDPPGGLICPHCRGVPLIKLNSRIRPGTLIDSCTVCFGVWLDPGELGRLASRGLLGWLSAWLGRRR